MDMEAGVWPAWRRSLVANSGSITDRLVRCADPDVLWDFYTRHGYPVRNAADVRKVPRTLQEYQVSLLRRRYRPWIVGEMAIASLAGPASPLPGAVLLGIILLQWGAAVGWAYGIDMHAQKHQKDLVKIVEREMAAVIFGDKRGVPACLLATVRVGLMGWGQELGWADRIIARVRTAYRRESEMT